MNRQLVDMEEFKEKIMIEVDEIIKTSLRDGMQFAYWRMQRVLVALQQDRYENIGPMSFDEENIFILEELVNHWVAGEDGMEEHMTQTTAVNRLTRGLFQSAGVGRTN